MSDIAFHKTTCDKKLHKNYTFFVFFDQMKLEANAELFRERVREAPISGNIDNPEGGFDALVQVTLMFFYMISILCSGGIGVSKTVSLQCGNFIFHVAESTPSLFLNKRL